MVFRADDRGVGWGVWSKDPDAQRQTTQRCRLDNKETHEQANKNNQASQEESYGMNTLPFDPIRQIGAALHKKEKMPRETDSSQNGGKMRRQIQAFIQPGWRCRT